MNVHKNAALTPKRREQMVRWVAEEGCTLKVSQRTVSKWMRRYRQGGIHSLQDRSSRPRRLHRPTSPWLIKEVLKWRHQKLTGHAIARRTGLARATVSRLLRRASLSLWRDLFPVPAVVRYERDKPGELLQIDIKKLGRFRVPGHRVTANRSVRAHGHAGWEYVFVVIDDHSRLAHAAILPNEKARQRPHFSLGLHPPVSRIPLPQNNLSTLHS